MNGRCDGGGAAGKLSGSWRRVTAPASRRAVSAEAAARRVTVLAPLAAQPACSRAAAKTAALALGLSERQIYNWVRRLRLANGDVVSLARRGTRTTKGITRLVPDMEEQLGRIIAEEILQRAAGRESGLFTAIVTRCQREMSPAPSDSTIFRRLRNRVGRRPKSQGASDGAYREPPGVLRRAPPEVSTESLLSPLYDTIGNPVGWRAFLNDLSHSYGGAMSGIAMHDYAAGTGFADASAGLGREYEGSYARYYCRLNPWLGMAEQRKVGLATVSDGLLPYHDLLRTEFYNDWCRPQGIGGGVGVTVERNGRHVMALTVLLSRPTIEEDPAAVSRLQALTPHLLWVSQLQRQFAALEARAAAAEGALDRLATAMLVVDAAGRVIYMNTLAERLVELADGVAVRGGRLELASSAESDSLRHLIKTSLRTTPELGSQPGGVMCVSRPSGSPSFELLAAPVAEGTVKLKPGGAIAAIFIRDPATRMTTPVEWVRKVFDLTAAEARLMQAVLAGESLEVLQGRWRLGRETLRTQLKSVFQKTGVSRQSDLVRIGLRSITATYR